jgi:hypothetical protein
MPGFRGAADVHYDPDHARTRKTAFTALPEYSPCVRCGRSMWKWATEKPDRLGRTRSALHYDHNHARTGYLGFSHQLCNVKAGAAHGARIANARRRTQRATTRIRTDLPRW